MGELMKLNETKEMAEHFFKSGIFQDVKDMSVALVKIQAGQELGISPIMAMKEVYLIPSKAGVKIQIGASLQAAMIKKSGKYDYRIVDHSKEICTIHFFERRGDKWEKIGDESYTIGDARAAGLTAGKDVWTKHPKNMLFARAMSNGAKWHCPDVFGGAIYNESDEFPESKFEAEIVEAKPDHLAKHFELDLKGLKEIIDSALEKNDLFNMKKELVNGLKSLSPVDQEALIGYFVYNMGELPIGDLIGTFEVMPTTDLLGNTLEPGDWKREKPSEVFTALKKKMETEAFTLLSLDVFAQEIAANKDLLSSNELAELREIFKETKIRLNKIEQGEITL